MKDNRNRNSHYPNDAFIDGCETDFTLDPLPDEESDLFVLFAEALDPNDPKTIEEAKAEWEEVLK